MAGFHPTHRPFLSQQPHQLFRFQVLYEFVEKYIQVADGNMLSDEYLLVFSCCGLGGLTPHCATKILKDMKNTGDLEVAPRLGPKFPEHLRKRRDSEDAIPCVK